MLIKCSFSFLWWLIITLWILQFSLNSWNNKEPFFFLLINCNCYDNRMEEITFWINNFLNQRLMHCPTAPVQLTVLSLHENVSYKFINQVLKQIFIIINFYHKLMRTDGIINQNLSSLSNGWNKQNNIRRELMAGFNFFTFRNFFIKPENNNFSQSIIFPP